MLEHFRYRARNGARNSIIRRSLIVLLMAVAMTITSEPLQTVHSVLLSSAERASLDASALETMSAEPSEGQGNGFVRALKSPFKAFGKLFGRKKKDDSRLQRISNDDIKKFESVPGQQTNKSSFATASLPAAPVADHRTAAALHLEKGRELLNGGNLNEAIGELSLAASLDPKSGEASSLLGVAYESKGLRDLALKSLKAAINAEKDDPQHLNNLGYLLYRNGDYAEATKYLKRSAKLAPNDARVLNNLALAQFERGKFDDAYRSFAQAMGEYKGRLNMATRLEREGRSKEAIKHLEKAHALDPSSRDVLAKLVGLYEMTGRLSDAEEARRSIGALKNFAYVKEEEK